MEKTEKDINGHMWKKGAYIQDKDCHFSTFPDIGLGSQISPDMGVP
jgi:hypothetical protein